MASADVKLLVEQYHKKIELARQGATVNPFETPEEKKRRIESLKKDVGKFVTYYFSRYATSESADFQIRLAQRVARNPKCFELIRWGRGLAKSVWADLIIPLWLWARGESIYIVIVGNNETKAIQLLSDIQVELEANPRLKHDFGDQKLQGSWESGNFRTKDERFIGKALGMGQDPRGLRIANLRPNYIVCDDLEDKDTVKNPRRQDEVVRWILGSLIPCMDGPVRRYLHPNNDFAPRTIQNCLEKESQTAHVDLVKAYDKETYAPAWHQKYSADYYKEQEKIIGIIAAHAEYLHEPQVEGKVFTKDMFQYAPPPRIDRFKMLTAHWDVAYSGNNDYNAIGIWGLHGLDFWKLKAFCRQCKMEEAVRFMFEYEKTLPKGVMIQWRVEAQFWNDPVRQAIEKVVSEQGRWLNISIVNRSTARKFDRLMSMHPYYQNRRIYYNEKEQYNSDFQVSTAQLMGIEPGYRTHDDAPDADQQAVEYLAEFVTYGPVGNSGIQMGGDRRSTKY